MRYTRLGLLFILLGMASACRQKPAAAASDPLAKAYGAEQDWNDPQRMIPLDYQEAQGKRIFYDKCVWCHADSTPAGPSNRSNVTPTPALANDGAVLNPLSDRYLQNIIALGGAAVGKSAMMPPWGKTLTEGEIRALIAFMRAISQPPYRPTAQPASQDSGK